MTGPAVTSPTTQIPAHDITLTDGTDTLGFVMTDGGGNRVDPQRLLGAIQRIGLSRTALKTSEGGSAHTLTSSCHT